MGGGGVNAGTDLGGIKRGGCERIVKKRKIKGNKDVVGEEKSTY
jgi:hypothetical protein